MSVDKNLFLYDLAAVAIMKNESPYVKEWLDYHLLAGVNHFFIYDNEDTDVQLKILQPYVDAELVTYIPFPGRARQYKAYNFAARDFKFFCRYMTFIDGDEFIFPKSKPTITETVDEILSSNSKATALGVNWIFYGSNGQDKADYTRGVLERFTAHADNVDQHVKNIANPRMIDYFYNPHFAVYFTDYFCINESGKKFEGPFNTDKTADKISINHYHAKSREEYEKKINRGSAYTTNVAYDIKNFSHDNYNDVFDDSILKYRDERLKLIVPEGGDILETFAARNQINFDRILKAVTSNLLVGFEEDNTKRFLADPTNRFEYFDMLVKFLDKAPDVFFEMKLETYLTCFAASTYLKETFVDEELGSLLEEFSLYAICHTLTAGVSRAELQLLIKELPRILALSYPVVEKIRACCLKTIPQFMHTLRVYDAEGWKYFVHLDYLLNMLKTFDNYNHK